MHKAKDIMTHAPLTVGPDEEVAQAARIMLDKRVNGLPVVNDEGRLVGIITQSDLVTQQKRMPLPSIFTLLDGFISLGSTDKLEREMQKIAALTVAQAMTPDPVTVGPDTPLEELATLMVEHKFHTLPVVEGTRLTGVVGKEDILRTLLPSRDMGEQG